MNNRDLKDRLWVPLSVDILEDDALNECSIVAQAIYFRGLAHAKRASRNGLVTRRSVLGGLYGTHVLAQEHDTKDLETEVDAAVDELVDAELWARTDRDGTYQICGWLKHNEPVENVAERISERKAKRSANAHRSNHKRGLHDETRHPDCPICKEENPQVGAHADAERPQSDNPERNASGAPPTPPSERIDTEQEQEPNQEQQQQFRPSAPTPPDPDAVTTAFAVGELLGVNPMGTGIPGAVMASRARGWTDDALVALAEHAALRATSNPRGLWAHLVEVRQPPEPTLTTDELRAFLEANPDPQEHAA